MMGLLWFLIFLLFVVWVVRYFKRLHARIVVYEPIGDGTKDRGEKPIAWLLFNDGIYTDKNRLLYSFDDIDYVDYFRSDEIDSQSIKEGALLGWMLGGALGATAGGVMSAGDKVWICEISVSGVVKYYKFSEGTKIIFVKWATKHNILKN